MRPGSRDGVIGLAVSCLIAVGTRSGDARGQPAPPAEPVPEAPADQGWAAGDHLTGEWGGVRSALADRGATIDVVYASDAFAARGGTAVLGHVDAALTFDSHKLGLWDGGTFYVLGQNNTGSGINDRVGSAQPVTNLEAQPYTQLTELFVEQTAFGDRLRVRIGKQDANREFGTPRFGGNFINNNFGMYPTAPLPSYPTTGLGAFVAVQPTRGFIARLALYEASPEIGGLGLSTAFRAGSGVTLAASAAVTHHVGPGDRNGGTTSVGVWRQSHDVTEVGVDPPQAPRTFGDNAGFFVQHDERFYLHPEAPDDPRGLTVILRFGWAEPDRNEVARYAGGSAAWHGIGPRHNDTAGIGGGYFTIADPLGGGPGPGSEWFVEAFYKLRLTNFVSLQPDLQGFRHPGGDGANAWVAGVRLKLKL